LKAIIWENYPNDFLKNNIALQDKKEANLETMNVSVGRIKKFLVAITALKNTIA